MSLSPTARVPSMVKKCQRFRQRFNQLEVNIREQPRTRRLDIEQELNTNGLARTSHGEMACKGSGVRIPLPPPSFSALAQPHGRKRRKDVA
jgi:hypothetical protein